MAKPIIAAYLYKITKLDNSKMSPEGVKYLLKNKWSKLSIINTCNYGVNIRDERNQRLRT